MNQLDQIKINMAALGNTTTVNSNTIVLVAPDGWDLNTVLAATDLHGEIRMQSAQHSYVWYKVVDLKITGRKLRWDSKRFYGPAVRVQITIEVEGEVEASTIGAWATLGQTGGVLF